MWMDFDVWCFSQDIRKIEQTGVIQIEDQCYFDVIFLLVAITYIVGVGLGYINRSNNGYSELDGILQYLSYMFQPLEAYYMYDLGISLY